MSNNISPPDNRVRETAYYKLRFLASVVAIMDSQSQAFDHEDFSAFGDMLMDVAHDVYPEWNKPSEWTERKKE